MSPRDEARELLHEALAGGNGANGGGRDDAAPSVPAPPVAAVHRPSTWDRPPAPGEVIGDGTAPERRVERVAIASDEDLDRFVRALAARLEDPGERSAIRAGRLKFALARDGVGVGHETWVAPGGAGHGPTGGVLRVERAAVTERTIVAAAAAGQRIVLGPGAVPTPLAREKARALGIRIEREKRC